VSKPRFVIGDSVVTPSSASTVQIYSTIRRALLDYVSTDGQRLPDFLEDRIYVRAQPTPVVYPYMTLMLNRTSLTAFNGYRETALLEVQCIGKPESQLPLVETAVDIADQCLTAYTQASSGLTVGRSRTRQTIPMFTDTADSSTVGVLATYELFLWPRVLTARAD
jgi:hypothetical protein